MSHPETGEARPTWQARWFRPVPGQVYALLRVVFGALGLMNLLGTIPVPMFWDLSDGLIPVPGGAFGPREAVLAAGLGSAAGWLLFLGSLAAYLCMAIGLLPNAAVAASFAAVILQTYWNPLPLSSAHQVLIVMLVALMFADCGQYLTVTARRSNQSVPAEDPPIWPLRLIQYQVALIYMNSGVWKYFGAPWREGTAIHYALNANVFHRFPGLTPEWTFALGVAGTYITLLWELLFPLLVFWRRTRAVTLAVGVALHLGVWTTLEVGPFSWMMLASYIAFLEPRRVAALVDRIRGAAPLTPSVGVSRTSR